MLFDIVTTVRILGCIFVIKHGNWKDFSGDAMKQTYVTQTPTILWIVQTQMTKLIYRITQRNFDLKNVSYNFTNESGHDFCTHERLKWSEVRYMCVRRSHVLVKRVVRYRIISWFRFIVVFFSIQFDFFSPLCRVCVVCRNCDFVNDPLKRENSFCQWNFYHVWCCGARKWDS